MGFTMEMWCLVAFKLVKKCIHVWNGQNCPSPALGWARGNEIKASLCTLHNRIDRIEIIYFSDNATLKNTHRFPCNLFFFCCWCSYRFWKAAFFTFHQHINAVWNGLSHSLGRAYVRFFISVPFIVDETPIIYPSPWIEANTRLRINYTFRNHTPVCIYGVFQFSFLVFFFLFIQRWIENSDESKGIFFWVAFNI